MKILTLISCLLLITHSTNANIVQPVKDDASGITQNKRVEKKQSFKDFLKHVEKIKGHKLNWRERIRLRFIHIMLPKFTPKSRNEILLAVVLILLMLLAIVLAILLLYIIIKFMISFLEALVIIPTG